MSLFRNRKRPKILTEDEKKGTRKISEKSFGKVGKFFFSFLFLGLFLLTFGVELWRKEIGRVGIIISGQGYGSKKVKRSAVDIPEL